MIDAEGMETLAPFYDRDLIVGQPGIVKSGKEGTVYRCLAHPSAPVRFYAAKMYRPRHMRTFQNDATYREGRVILDRGRPRRSWARAFKAKGAMGRAVQYQTWVDHEYRTLSLLRATGADVPAPVARSSGAILMEYVGDEHWAAPALQQVTLRVEEVSPLLNRVLSNVELWLRHNCIHADLSSFNILYWEGKIVIIDFPQAVDPRFNPNARDLLIRDLTNVYTYWSRYGVDGDPVAYGDDLWRRFMQAEL